MRGCRQPAASPEVAQLVGRVLDGGQPLDEAEITRLYRARGADFQVGRHSCLLRRTCPGDGSGSKGTFSRTKSPAELVRCAAGIRMKYAIMLAFPEVYTSFKLIAIRLAW